MHGQGLIIFFYDGVGLLTKFTVFAVHYCATPTSRSEVSDSEAFPDRRMRAWIGVKF